MIFDYFYEEQSESYSFYRIPKMLFTEEIFENLSTDAKVLYGLLLDRISLSRENGWLDDAGRVYVYYTIRSVKKSMRCANTKACGLLKELNEFGLIERKKQGLGKPTIIYVKDFTRFRKSELLDSGKQNSVIPQTGTLDIRKSESNKTEINKTEISKTNPILSGADKDMDERELYRKYLYSQLDMEVLYDRYPYDGETLDSITDLMLDVICSKRKTIRSIIQQNNEIGNQIYHLDEEIAEKKVLQNRYKALQSQYSSDLKRLTFMVEGEIRKKDYVAIAPRECPFCGNHLSEEKTDSCIEAASAEIDKLEPKMADLKSVQKSLKNELEEIISERDRLKALMDELEERVQGELQPKVDELRTTMADYAVALANHSSLSALGRAQSTIRENLTEYKSKAEPPKFSIKEYYNQEFMERFQTIIDKLLQACKFDGFREAYFDLNTFDVVINGTRKKSQGQGYRAFINVIVSMAMQEYLKQYGIYRPNIFVIDSPILSLKEDVDASELASESMKSSLFKYFINHPCAEQIIIIENEVPKLDYSGVKMRKFFKGNGFWKTDPTTYQA